MGWYVPWLSSGVLTLLLPSKEQQPRMQGRFTHSSLERGLLSFLISMARDSNGPKATPSPWARTARLFRGLGSALLSTSLRC